MKKILSLVLLTMVLAVGTANAESYSSKFGIYVLPKITYGSLSMSLGGGRYSDEAAGFSAAAGMDFTYSYNLPFRAELEYNFVDTHISQSISSPSINLNPRTELALHTFFVNLYYDIYTLGNITPYFGGGIGFSFIKLSGASGGGYSDGSESSFAWNLVGGVAIPILETFAIDISYRMVWHGSHSTAIESIRSQQVQAGLRIIF